MSDKLDQIQASYIDTYKGVGAYSKLRAALLKWRDEAVVAELNNILANSSGGGSWRRVIIGRIKQLEGAE